MKLKLFKMMSAFILCFAALASVAAASGSKDHHHVKKLVALGDSIPYGYNLSATNDVPSKLSYPSLIAHREGYKVYNLSVPGHTSTDMLALFENKSYRQHIAQADVVTIEIGSNDLLRGAGTIIEKLSTVPNYEPSQEDVILLSKIGGTLAVNVKQIVTEVRKLTDAPIVLYNVYNPYYVSDEATAPLLGVINLLYSFVASQADVVVADASTAFRGKQNTLIIPSDMHPTARGQQVLAQLAIDALATIAKSPSAL